jgi:hypothetical protein
MAELNGKQFRVGGVNYAVEIMPNLRAIENLYGEVTYHNAKIRIDGDMHRDRTNETLVHELIHAMMFEAGYDEHDEDFVRRFSAMLHQVLLDNDFTFVKEAE